jgi:outer membrane protein assembly factor BamA
MNHLWFGMECASETGMKNIKRVTLCVLLLWPVGLYAGDQSPEGNVNERYVVESVIFTGEGESRVSQNLRDEAKKLEGEKYSEKTANECAERIRAELKEYCVTVKVERGEKPDYVKVAFQVEKTAQKHHGHSIGFRAPFVYHSKQGFSISPEIVFDSHPNYIAFGFVNDADQLLERNAGFYLRYEHKKLGTDVVHFRMDFESSRQKYNPATESALAERPDLPGLYRTRQNFAPSLSFHPIADFTIRTGVSFQRFQIQYPQLHTETAYAGVADVEYQKKLSSDTGYEQRVSGAYSLRTATRVLDSDRVYTRHYVTADYSLKKGKSYFDARFLSGYITGTAPLFERFSLGNCNTLRGWNKFDVAPLGGTRAAHGTLEYRYGQFRTFYDVGAVWDSGQYSRIRHGLGFGWVHKNLFASIAFPVRLHDVSPVFMMGMRLGAR